MRNDEGEWKGVFTRIHRYVRSRFEWLGLVLLAVAVAEASEDTFLDDLQERTLRWFLDFSAPPYGLTLDRAPHENGFSSVAAVGFALTSYAVGVERGWLSRASAVERTLTTLRFFDRSPQSEHRSNTTGYRGFYYHFIDPETGFRYRQVELSTIDTALLMAGVLFAGEYYQSSDPEEQEIRQLAERLYRRVDWQWMQQDQGLIGHGWKPESGSLQHGYGGYNEAMLLYVLALGSPTYPVTENAWDQFMSTCQWGSFQGQDFVQFSPLFGHQYSHVWIDFRQITDDYMREKGVDWFENARRATLAQASYGRENPQKWRDYGKYVWGWTACDGPFNGSFTYLGEKRRFWTYMARGVSALELRDDGTVAPTAAGGSLPFAPDRVIPTLEYMKWHYGEDLYTPYGFVDAFNPSLDVDGLEFQHGRRVPGKGWFDDEHLGIDQGPILLMAENHRSELIWKVMKRSPYIRRGLRRAGFTGGWLEDVQEPAL